MASLTSNITSSFNWNKDDKLEELTRFKRCCKYVLAGLYGKLDESAQNTHVLIWIGQEKIHEEAQLHDTAQSLNQTWSVLETALQPKTNPRVFRDMVSNRCKRKTNQCPSTSNDAQRT